MNCLITKFGFSGWRFTGILDILGFSQASRSRDNFSRSRAARENSSRSSDLLSCEETSSAARNVIVGRYFAVNSEGEGSFGYTARRRVMHSPADEQYRANRSTNWHLPRGK